MTREYEFVIRKLISLGYRKIDGCIFDLNEKGSIFLQSVNELGELVEHEVIKKLMSQKREACYEARIDQTFVHTRLIFTANIFPENFNESTLKNLEGYTFSFGFEKQILYQNKKGTEEEKRKMNKLTDDLANDAHLINLDLRDNQYSNGIISKYLFQSFIEEKK
ncbi:hypothetical protein [Oenococcus sicerae]|uniref:hypothetical protein n=1 Tax=Oenococcus sicerae TaxID=2203724 RepID=UPI0039E8D197